MAPQCPYRYFEDRTLASRHSKLVGQKVIDQLRPHKARCRTLTFDNGKEFAEHELIGKCLQAKAYFAHPQCSCERGLNEIHNGLLPQFFPKGASLLNVSQAQVDEAVYALSHRPRKCLGYLTPHEVFYGLEMTPLTLDSAALCT